LRDLSRHARVSPPPPPPPPHPPPAPHLSPPARVPPPPSPSSFSSPSPSAFHNCNTIWAATVCSSLSSEGRRGEGEFWRAACTLMGSAASKTFRSYSLYTHIRRFGRHPCHGLLAHLRLPATPTCSVWALRFTFIRLILRFRRCFAFPPSLPLFVVGRWRRSRNEERRKEGGTEG